MYPGSRAQLKHQRWRRALFDFFAAWRVLLPSFCHRHEHECHENGDDTDGSSKALPIGYIQGLRGFAALSIIAYHWSRGSYPQMDVAFGDSLNPDDSTRLTSFFQLPLVRLMYTADAGLAFFFLISGFVLALGPLRKQGASSTSANAESECLSSLALRRSVRLYVPVFASIAISYIAQVCGVEGLQYRLQHKIPWANEVGLLSYLQLVTKVWTWDIELPKDVLILDAEAWAWRLNPYLWAIPLIWRCSLMVYLVLLVLWRVRQLPRAMLTTVLSVWAFAEGQWDVALFLSGALLAQRRVCNELQLRRCGSQLLPSHSVHRADGMVRKLLSSLAYNALLCAGLILCGYPVKTPSNDSVPIYGWLASVTPEHTGGRRLWYAMGSILILGTVEQTVLRRMCELSVLQYLGKISFSLYLIQWPLFRIFGWPMKKTIAKAAAGSMSSHAAFALGTIAFLPLAIWSADVFERAIECRAPEVGRWIERCLVQGLE